MRVHRPAGSVRTTLRGRGGPVLVGEVGVYRPESRRRPVPASGQRCSRAVAGDRARPKPGRGQRRSLPGLAARRRVPGPARKRQNQRGPGEWVGNDLDLQAEDLLNHVSGDDPPGVNVSGGSRSRGFTRVARSAPKRRVRLEPPRGSLTGAGPWVLSWGTQAAPAGASLWLRDGWWSPARSDGTNPPQVTQPR